MSGYAVPPPPPAATRPGVASEVEAELAGQIAPLETEIGGFQRAETRAQQDLAALFAGIMPFVAGSAQRVAEQYGATNAAQAGIFNQAWQRLNTLRGERASEAQALAQQIGAPVPLDGMFTEALDTERGAFIPEAAGELLKAHTIGQAGVQQAEAFAGRVFPLKNARMSREITNHYRDQISDLKKQIATIKGMKPGLINERLRARQLEDYEMKLARAEALFQREQTKRSLALEEKRLALQEKELAEVTRSNKAGEALDAKSLKLTKQQKQMGNSTYINQQKQNIVALANGMVSPGPNLVDVKRAEWRQMPDGTWEHVKWTETRDLGAQAIRNPQQLLRQVLAQAGISKNQKVLYSFAVAQVARSLRAAGLTGIPDNPAQWDRWWKQRQARLQKAQKAQVTKNMKPPYPPSPPGGGGYGP